MTGILYGVGVGPGDPELLTVKAARLIEKADLVAYPVNGEGFGLARQIASSFMRSGCREYGFFLPMLQNRTPAQLVYDRVAASLEPFLIEGQKIVVLCEGDPFFYGSFWHIFSRFAERYKVEVIPAVSSLSAISVAAGRALVKRGEILKVLPAYLDDSILRRELTHFDTAVLVKSGRHLPRIRSLLEAMGLQDRTLIVEAASLPEQKVISLRDFLADSLPYFASLLIYEKPVP